MIFPCCCQQNDERIYVVQIVAVAARRLEDAQQFATKFNIPKAYGSYEELAKDDNIGEENYLFVLEWVLFLSFRKSVYFYSEMFSCL